MFRDENDATRIKKMQEVVAFFETAQLPKAMRLSSRERIVDVSKFIDSHLCGLRANWKNTRLSEPMYDRLMKAYELIKSKNYEELDIEASVQPIARKPKAKTKTKRK